MDTPHVKYRHEFLGNIFPWVAIGVLLGLVAVYVPLEITLAVVAGILVLKYVAKHPELGILIIVILTSSIVFEESLPLIPIGVGSFHLSDVLLLFLLASLGYRHIADKGLTFAKSPLNLPLLLFFAVSMVSAVMSVTRYGSDFADVARLVRTISYYLLFFIITNLVTEQARIRFLIKGLFAIALVVGAAMVAQAIVGESVMLMPGRIENASSIGKEFGTLRILPPGQMLVFVAFMTAICLLVFVQDRPVLFSGPFLMLPVLGAGILLTYNRSYWVAAILGVMILLVITATDNKLRLMSLLAVVFIIGGSLTAMYGGSGGKLGTMVDAVSHRFSSLFAGKDLSKSNPVDDRRTENEYAIAHIKRHPLLGIGLGTDYRPKIYGKDDTLTYYVHNAYLWLLTDMGVIGFLCFTWFYGGFLVRVAGHWQRIKDGFMKSAVAGCMLSGIGILFLAFVNPVFMQWYSIVIIAIMAGLAESIFRLNEAGQTDTLAASERPYG